MEGPRLRSEFVEVGRVVERARVDVFALFVLGKRDEAHDELRIAPRLLEQRAQELGILWQRAARNLLLQPHRAFRDRGEIRLPSRPAEQLTDPC